jgi:hypothetical protein
MTIEEALVNRFGAILSLTNLASVLDRSPEGLRISLRAPNDWVNRINATKFRLGRRVYGPSEALLPHPCRYRHSCDTRPTLWRPRPSSRLRPSRRLPSTAGRSAKGEANAACLRTYSWSIRNPKHQRHTFRQRCTSGKGIRDESSTCL